jgi:integrase
MSDSVRPRRDGSGRTISYQYCVDLGEQLAQRCTACGKRRWVDKAKLTTCSCGGDLTTAALERRQKFVGGFKTRAEAKHARAEALVKLRKGDDPFPDKITLGRFVKDNWLPHLETQGRVRVRTVRSYDQLMRDHALPLIGTMELRKVRPAHIQEVLDAMTAKGRAARTVSHARECMSACFQHALRMQLVMINPVRGTQAPKKPEPQLRIPNARELRKIIDTAKNSSWEVPVLLSATTGARRSEVLGLRWKNVDLERGRATIVEQLQRLGGKLDFVVPKTERAKRTVPLQPEVVTTLRKHRTEQAWRLRTLGIQVADDQVVCDRGDGQPIDPSTYTHAVSRLATTAGCAGVRLHDLRHGVATVLAASGNRPELTSKLLGHATVAFTLQTYTHPSDDEMDEVAEILRKAISPEAS